MTARRLSLRAKLLIFNVTLIGFCVLVTILARIFYGGEKKRAGISAVLVYGMWPR